MYSALSVGCIGRCPEPKFSGKSKKKVVGC